VVSLSEYLAAVCEKHERLAAITFDDGARETFDAVTPALRRDGVPATFFVSTGHLDGGPLLWFSYLNALCFENSYREVMIGGHLFRLGTVAERKQARRALGAMARGSQRPSGFVEQLWADYPLEPELRERYGGMTADQLAAAGKDDLLEIASHTVSHPYLTTLSPADQTKEISESKDVLSALTGRPVRYFAYPGGDYDGAVLGRVREAGYEAAFAVRPRRVGSALFEIGRVGIYSTSWVKFRLKTSGLVGLAEYAGIRVG
jgi:peptidoglycan/xylan/chitin deacetylase (PgdA/CDA1 family)